MSIPVAKIVHDTLKPPPSLPRTVVVKGLTDIFNKHCRRYLYVKPEFTKSGKEERIVFSGRAPCENKGSYGHVIVTDLALASLRAMFDFDKEDPAPKPVTAVCGTAKTPTDATTALHMLSVEVNSLGTADRDAMLLEIGRWLYFAILRSGRLAVWEERGEQANAVENETPSPGDSTAI